MISAILSADFALTAENADKPIIIHQLFETPMSDEIHYRCFECFKGKLTGKEQSFETDEILQLKQRFREEINLQ